MFRLPHKGPTLMPWAGMSDIEVRVFKAVFGSDGFDVRPGDVVPLHRACQDELKVLEAEFHLLRQQST